LSLVQLSRDFLCYAGRRPLHLVFLVLYYNIMSLKVGYQALYKQQGFLIVLLRPRLRPGLQLWKPTKQRTTTKRLSEHPVVLAVLQSNPIIEQFQYFRLFGSIDDSSKIIFNIGLIHATAGSHEAAVDYFHQARCFPSLPTLILSGCVC
jgi:hypothetical protein